ncbi:hypothetical protein BCR41DRAFT_386432 [Lobosporangium transversale]|uniref:Uncharacterized protein n=1 Tax=Lobosporangium transversale TaxID=64571 RepID=A0A1Y2GPE3_9FUNG|nr:hypothetical protein BCR41DRAFT_386432 [Lobosporangium transversale]ORZ16042.1 hypothetical protein BCR41DRAFT_386432 [Lobosporangium transversale]|eukprot:XP_021881389.1 hypothetical protein BCR41DRAFT_386432 [Lobosporangium transversale]
MTTTPSTLIALADEANASPVMTLQQVTDTVYGVLNNSDPMHLELNSLRMTNETRIAEQSACPAKTLLPSELVPADYVMNEQLSMSPEPVVNAVEKQVLSILYLY